MSAALSKALRSDHRRREIAKQEAADFCILAGVTFLLACGAIVALLSAAGIL